MYPFRHDLVGVVPDPIGHGLVYGISYPTGHDHWIDATFAPIGLGPVYEIFHPLGRCLFHEVPDPIDHYPVDEIFDPIGPVDHYLVDMTPGPSY